MVIVMHDYGGYPFIYDLSYELSERGFQVTHIFSSASGSPSGIFRENKNLKVIDLGADLPKVKKGSFVSRFFSERHYGSLIASVIKEINPAMVISGNTPLEAQKRIAAVCNEKEIRFVYWLQDLLSIAAENVLNKKNKLLGALVGGYFKAIEKSLLKGADRVIAISEDFSDLIKKWGVDQQKISVLENWSGLATIPVVSKDNPFSRQHGLDQSFNFVYSGTLGMKQNPEVLIEIAEQIQGRENVRLVVVAAGTGVEFVQKRTQELGLKNVLILPLQPFDTLPNVLGSGDVLLAMLESDAAAYCVPSKILTYYCAGKASLLILSKENLAARQTLAHGLGFVIEPGDSGGLKSLIDQMVGAPDQLDEVGKRARAYAERQFPIGKIADKFLKILNTSPE